MKANEITAELEKVIDKKLAADLVSEFLELKKDYQTQTLSRASAGKFVETIVQLLEFVETGKYSTQPSVDSFLKNLESRQTNLTDDLKICLSRIARATYTLRNKRNILHKGVVDANVYDLKYIFASVQWMLTEIVKEYITSDIHLAGRIIDFIQVPVTLIHEKINNRSIVFASCTVVDELALVLYYEYPAYVNLGFIQSSMDRRAKSSISNAIKKLWEQKLLHKDSNGMILTQNGFLYAEKVLKNLIQSQ